MTNRPRKWTKEQLTEAIKSSSSIREVLKKLGLIPAGGNYAQMHKYVAELNIDTSHFNGQGWRKGSTLSVIPAKSLKEIMICGSYYRTHKLKARLWHEGIKPKECELCGWAQHALDGRLPLELDHINGNRYDHRLENLRILCPNCHSLQSTHRGKNIKRT